MSDDIADAIIALLNAGADPEALQEATQDIEGLDFVLVEDIPAQPEAVH